MSAQIEAERSRYYDELEAAQRGGLDITRWLQWFVDCLGQAIDRAHETLHAVLHTAAIRQQLNHGPVNERQQRVVERMLDDFKGFMTTGKYAKIAKCSADTALRDIRILLERGVLVQNPGGGRKTSYRLADPPADRLPQ